MVSREFMAVQCCQCSTMQVKQKPMSKKSNGSINKWTCVVCNQKQSLLQIFAQGFMAKDLRQFVQSFNMARAENAGEVETQTVPSFDAFHFDDQDDQFRKRSSDWTEYLDLEDNANQENEHQGDDFGPKIVTELPNNLFKKPKLRNYDRYGCHKGSGNDGSKPVYSKGEGEERKKDSAKHINPSKWSDYMTRQSQEQRTDEQPAMATKASKWNAYITHDDNLNVATRGNFADDSSHHVWETMVDDQRVADDIHPDFM